MTITLDGLLSAIAASDPVALAAGKDYAMEFLGANTPEEAMARLIDVAADRGLDTLQAVMRRPLPNNAQIVSTGEIYPTVGENWIVAGTGACVTIHSQRGGTVYVLGSARVRSFSQRDGVLHASESVRLLSCDQQGGSVLVLNGGRCVSRSQRDGHVSANNASQLLSRDQQGGSIYIFDSVKAISRNMMTGVLCARDTSRLLSCGQRGGWIHALGKSKVLSRSRHGGMLDHASSTATVKEVPWPCFHKELILFNADTC